MKVLTFLGVTFLFVALASAIVTLLNMAGAVNLAPVRWLPPFFVALWGFTGLMLFGVGHDIKTAFRLTQERDERLRRLGLAGTAIIVDARDTGTTLNDDPQVSCTFAVSLDGREPYEVTQDVIVPRLKIGLLEARRPIPVLVDPDDRNVMMVRW